MKRNLAALTAGLIFGLGLTISEMVNPAKVLAFLDLFGDWDPSLAFVMGAALMVTAVGYRLVWRRAGPVFAETFQVPGNRKVDARLAAGAILFGAGWGLVGLCPGPAISAITIGGPPAIGFLAAMLVGMALYEIFERSSSAQKPTIPNTGPRSPQS
ncbi:MAG: YeeE/YedE family protein [Pseudomonadota bacterium]